MKIYSDNMDPEDDGRRDPRLDPENPLTTPKKTGKMQYNDIRDEWYEKAKTEIQTPEQLKAFAEEISARIESSDEPYNDSSNGAAALALAAMNMTACMYGMTGFQMGWVMWQVIDQMLLSEHDCGMKLVNYNDMLYPQYEHRFGKTIDADTWGKLQEKAARLVGENKKSKFPACKGVADHWKSIADGKVPFGYTVAGKQRKEGCDGN